MANSCPKRDYWGWGRAWRKARGQVHLGVFSAACAPPSPLSTGLVPRGKGHLGCLGRCGLHPTVPAVFVLRCHLCVPLCADLGRWLVDRRKGSFTPLLSPSPLGASSPPPSWGGGTCLCWGLLRWRAFTSRFARCQQHECAFLLAILSRNPFSKP